MTSLQKIFPKVRLTQSKRMNTLGMKILVEDSNSCTGEFVIYSLIEMFLRRTSTPGNVVFVAATQSFTHYNAVLKKIVSKTASLRY